MPKLGESPAGHSRVLPVILLAHLCTGAWLTSATVYFVDVTGGTAPASASAAIGGSYLVSVVLAHATSLRSLRLGLALLCLGLWTQTVAPWAGIAIVMAAYGLLRPALLGVVGRSDPDPVHAFQRYNIVINVGYLGGGLLADAIRLTAGYRWLFGCLGCLALAAFAASLRLGPGKPANPSGEKPSASSGKAFIACAMLASVATMYFVLSQVATVLSLVAESESRLKAGTLGGLHGALVLVISLLLALRPSFRPLPAMSFGLTVWAGGMAALAALRSPIGTPSLVLVLLAMSLGESVLGPNLMALGSRLAGFGRTAYWLSATLGYGCCMLYNFGWGVRSHTQHFGLIAGGCLVGSLVCVGLAVGKAQPSEPRL